MTEIPKLDDVMGSDSNYEEDEKVCVFKGVNGLQQSTATSDCFVLDMERFSHLTEAKDINANSRITRSISRKGYVRGRENKLFTGNETSPLSSSQTAALHGSSTLEKPEVVAMGATTATGNSIIPQVHHQITITNGSLSGGAAESKFGGKRSIFRRSLHAGIIDPRRILFFFATLSCMGTILLIYFTLSMGKPEGDDSALN